MNNKEKYWLVKVARNPELRKRPPINQTEMRGNDYGTVQADHEIQRSSQILLSSRRFEFGLWTRQFLKSQQSAERRFSVKQNDHFLKLKYLTPRHFLAAAAVSK